jgi:magnesium chelatase family protein
MATPVMRLMIDNISGSFWLSQMCTLVKYGNSANSRIRESGAGYHRILKLARTIADLTESEEIGSAHLAEALQYRPKLMLS